MSRRLATFSVVLAGILLVLACLGFALPIDFILNLAFGWILYLARTVPQVTVSAGGVATAVACLAVLAVGLHWFFRWLFGQMNVAAPGEPAERRWRLRWSMTFLVAVVLMFVAGIAAVGITHQTGWLLTSPEPLVRSSGGLSDRMWTSNNLKQIGVALHDYHETAATFPPGGIFDAHGRRLHGWQTLLLPYLERKDLYDRIRLDVPWDRPDNAPPFQTEVTEFLHPRSRPTKDRAGFALSHYAGNARLLGGNTPMSLEEITDGASATVQAGEVAGQFKPWGHPTNWRDPALGINRAAHGFGSPNRQGAHFLFADGSVRFLRGDVSADVLKALSTPNGGENVPVPEW